MRIIQLIDSLEAGGAERMAVSYANALAEKIEFSALVVTRKEGPLLNQIEPKVSYLFLNKKRTIDFKAIYSLRSFAKKNKVTIIHAHSTSFFLAFLVKVTFPSIQLIWHDHYGARVYESRKSNIVLCVVSLFFSAVFVVNNQLELWAKKKIFVKNVFFIPNFAISDVHITRETFLKANHTKRIVCVANLKNPKNHIAILIAYNDLDLDKLGWSLHFIGKDYADEYSNFLKEYVRENKLSESVFIYNSCNDIQHILSQAEIGILSSTDEGFPVALLEYGLAKLSVVSTNVGYCSTIIKNDFNGLLFDPLSQKELQNQLYKMIYDESKRKSFGLHLQQLVVGSYSKKSAIDILMERYKSIQYL